MSEIKDLIIIGAGPAGMSAAIYAKRAALDFLLIEKEYMSGGQVLTTYEVENYPGLYGVSGMELASAFTKHAEAMDIRPVKAKVKEIERQTDSEEQEGRNNQGGQKVSEDAGPLYRVVTSKETYLTRAIIYAAGAHHRKLGIPGEEQFAGMGVSYCATCDGNFFRGRDVIVVGGGDVALEDAIYLARICRKVTVVIRRDVFRGAKGLQERLMAYPNVEIVRNRIPTEIKGSDLVEGLAVRPVGHSETVGTAQDHGVQDKKDAPTTEFMKADGIFIAVGIEPESNEIRNLVELDDNGFVVADEDCRTSAKGVYAAGDIRTKHLRQILTAAADGANAVTSAAEDFQK